MNRFQNFLPDIHCSTNWAKRICLYITASLLTFGAVGLVINLFIWLGAYSFMLLLVPALTAAIYYMGYAIIDMLTHFERDNVIESRKAYDKLYH